MRQRNKTMMRDLVAAVVASSLSILPVSPLRAGIEEAAEMHRRAMVLLQEGKLMQAADQLEACYLAIPVEPDHLMNRAYTIRELAQLDFRILDEQGGNQENSETTLCQLQYHFDVLRGQVEQARQENPASPSFDQLGLAPLQQTIEGRIQNMGVVCKQEPKTVDSHLSGESSQLTDAEVTTQSRSTPSEDDVSEAGWKPPLLRGVGEGSVAQSPGSVEPVSKDDVAAEKPSTHANSNPSDDAWKPPQLRSVPMDHGRPSQEPTSKSDTPLKGASKVDGMLVAGATTLAFSGVALGGLIASLIIGREARKDGQAYYDQEIEKPDAKEKEVLEELRKQGFYKRGVLANQFAIATGVISGVALVTGVTLIAVSKRKKRSQVAVAPFRAASSVGGMVTLRF